MELPTRKQNRLSGYDYSTVNAYFVTICTHNRRSIFWENVGAIMDRPQNVRLSALGEIVNQAIRNIPDIYPAVSVDKFVIMPNHVHLLLQICSDADGRSMIAPTISSVVRQMKGTVTKQAGFPVWQKGFYDHVVRSSADYREIWAYIENNPAKWAEDKLNGSLTRE